MPLIDEHKLESIYAAIAKALGARDEQASLFAACLLRADLRGCFTQGSGILPYLVELGQKGLQRFDAPFTIVSDKGACVVVDGGHGVGQIVATRAMDMAIQKAKEHGVGCVWVRDGGDFALTANHSMQALAHGQVGIAMRNGSPRVAPWGGRDPFFGTNPISVAIPGGEERAIVIDMASGSMSVGRVVYAAREGRTVAAASLVDESGRVSDDPQAIVNEPLNRESAMQGAINPLGHKGYAWLLIVELLAGLLSGSGTSNLNDFEPSSDRPWGEGMFFMAIDVASVAPVAEFGRWVDELIRALKAARPAEGFAEVLVPGEIEDRSEETNRRQGVPIRDEDWAAILRAAQDLGIDVESL